MVYERNGGSSADVADAAASGCGADRIGPVSSAGTSNTIRATRMIAPVSRSFTQSVYPKPLERRAHRMHRTAHDDAIAGTAERARLFTARCHARRERHGARRDRQPPREFFGAAAAQSGQRAHDPAV